MEKKTLVILHVHNVLPFENLLDTRKSDYSRINHIKSTLTKTRKKKKKN